MTATLLNGDIAGTASVLTEQTVAVTSTQKEPAVGWYQLPRLAAGTGMIMSSSGYIVTNFHVISGGSDISVLTPDNETYPARLVGYDAATDLALLRIKTKAPNLSPIELGDSSKIRPGDPVIAVGNALGLPGGPTVSLGVVSAVQRPIPMSEFIFEGLIQTDAAINPGNSGGPLAILDGKVIGMNTAIIPMAQGMGFAIPSNTIRDLVEKIMENGRILRPWIGISGLDVRLDSKRGAVLVTSVTPGSPADNAGIVQGDIILKFDGKNAEDMRTLIRLIHENGIGKPADIWVRRHVREGRLQIIAREMPPDYLRYQFR